MQGEAEEGATTAWPSTLGLDALIGAVARGENGAFERVFQELSAPAYGIALAVLADRAQAEEVAQDVLAEIWQTAGRYDPAKGSALGWALMIARRRAIDRLRSITAGSRRERSDNAATGGWDQVDEAVQEIHDREQLRRGLADLPGLQREAVMLAFFDGHTYAEVAVILGIPAGTAKTRIRSALASLRQHMRSDS
jgi:RNA polymerase sigma-70 factor (ECF subfamily)